MILYLLSFLCGVLGSWVVLKHKGMIATDTPNNRSSHNGAIPKGGGIGILIAFALASIVLEIPLYFGVPAIIISLVSLWGGDKHLLSVEKRLIVHFGCSVCLIIFFLITKQANLSIYLLCIPVSIFVVGTSNFFNFMDGIDGIAGISGVIGFLLLFFYSHLSEVCSDYGVLCIALVASCLGFLCFNIPRAKVFIGDVGSILLGFLFASLVVVLSESVTDFFVMAGFLAPFYFDEFFTMAIRIKDGDSLLIAHRKHTYQLLANELGIDHLKISLSYGMAQLIIGLSAISLKSTGLHFILAIYFFYFMCFILITFQIRKKARLNES